MPLSEEQIVIGTVIRYRRTMRTFKVERFSWNTATSRVEVHLDDGSWDYMVDILRDCELVVAPVKTDRGVTVESKYKY